MVYLELVVCEEAVWESGLLRECASLSCLQLWSGCFRLWASLSQALPQPAGADLTRWCDVPGDPTVAHTAWDDHGWLLHLAISVKLFLILDKPGLHARKAAALIASFLHLRQALRLWHLHWQLQGCAGAGGVPRTAVAISWFSQAICAFY